MRNNVAPAHSDKIPMHAVELVRPPLMHPAMQAEIDEKLANELGSIGIQLWDASQNVLAILMRNRSAAHHAATTLQLSEQDFIIPGHSMVWKIMLELRKAGRPTLIQNVAARMDNLCHVRKSQSWLGYLAELWQDARSCEDIIDETEIAIERLRDLNAAIRAAQDN